MTKEMMVFLAITIYVFIRSVFVEPNCLEVTKYQIKDPSLDGIRIVFLSDFHFKKHDYRRLDKVAKLSLQQNPDLVLLGGDFARGKNYKHSMNINIIAQKLNFINAPVFAVLGEHDWWSDGKAITLGLKGGGITVLENQNKRILLKKRYVDIIGLADMTTRQPDIEHAFKKTNIPRIVLVHNPDIYYDILDEVSLILAGHTHGGQFILPFTPPIFVPSKYGSDFASGLIDKNHGNKMIISKGIGTGNIPLRLNCKPEIVVIDFVSEIQNDDSSKKKKKSKKK